MSLAIFGTELEHCNDLIGLAPTWKSKQSAKASTIQLQRKATSFVGIDSQSF